MVAGAVRRKLNVREPDMSEKKKGGGGSGG